MSLEAFKQTLFFLFYHLCITEKQHVLSHSSTPISPIIIIVGIGIQYLAVTWRVI